MRELGKLPLLYIVIPCYNEAEVLPVTAPLFEEQLNNMIINGYIHEDSKILFVNDGSTDNTWDIISELSDGGKVQGICLSRNRGHQNALLAGLMECRKLCDISISIDCDGQDDISVMSKMVEQYRQGYDVVYGVRNDRETDSFFKRSTAQAYYKVLKSWGGDVVYNHADYRLLSSRVLEELAEFEEVNLYLRGMIPLIGFKSTTVEYKREKRKAGKSHYSISKMFGLAFNGIANLSVRPLQLVTGCGMVVSFISFLGVIWAVVEVLRGNTVAGWASMTCIICFLSGVQLISIGIVGQYVGKIYMETKHRPRYIISERVGFMK